VLDRIGDRNIDNASVFPGNHAVEFPMLDQCNGMNAEGRSEQAVSPIRLSSALDVAQDSHAGFGLARFRDLRADDVSDAAKTFFSAEVVLFDCIPFRRQYGFGNNDKRKIAPEFLCRFDMCDNIVDLIVDLGNQDDVRAACDTGGQRDVAGIAAYGSLGGCCWSAPQPTTIAARRQRVTIAVRFNNGFNAPMTESMSANCGRRFRKSRACIGRGTDGKPPGSMKQPAPPARAIGWCPASWNRRNATWPIRWPT